MRTTRMLILAAIATVPAVAFAQSGTIVASGTGVVELVADRATVTAVVVTRAQTAESAGASNAATAAEVRTALTAQGVVEDAITTGRYNVRASWRRQDGERVADGYVAELSLHVKIDDIAQIGAIIDAALAGGANRVDGIAFESSQADAARTDAVALAVKDALRTAEAMAMAAGGGLGSLVELSERGGVRPTPEPRMVAAEAMAADMPTMITPGTLTVTAHVTGRWGFAAR